MPGALILEREDGGTEPLRLDPGSLDFGSVIALDGRRVGTALAGLPAQARGRYRIFDESAPELACHLTVAPRRCYLPQRPAGSPRLSGIATQLYALRRKGDQGAGDFTTLGEFAEMAANAGAATVGLNPLHALFSQDREHASPYYPSDRRFLDPLYIDAGVLEGPRAKAALARNADQIAALSALPDVDYPNVWALKRAILEAGFADFNHICERPIGYATRRAFEDFLERGGASLERFACFEAISEIRKREAWSSWPGPLRDGEPGALAAFMQKNAALVRFHLYLQWLADRQFREAAKRGRAAAPGSASTAIWPWAPPPMARKSGPTRISSLPGPRSARHRTRSRKAARIGASRRPTRWPGGGRITSCSGRCSPRTWPGPGRCVSTMRWGSRGFS